MKSVSTTFSAVGVTAELRIKKGQKLYYKFDVADIDDGVTSTVYVSGSVVFNWVNLGDF